MTDDTKSKTPTTTFTTEEFGEYIAHEVIEERLRQVAKWGDQAGEIALQGRPGNYNEAWDVKFQREADTWKEINDARVNATETEGGPTWDGILLEEVYEALAERDPAKRRAELVQAAAVIFAEIECIDRTPAQTYKPLDTDVAA